MKELGCATLYDQVIATHGLPAPIMVFEHSGVTITVHRDACVWLLKTKPEGVSVLQFRPNHDPIMWAPCGSSLIGLGVLPPQCEFLPDNNDDMPLYSQIHEDLFLVAVSASCTRVVLRGSCGEVYRLPLPQITRWPHREKGRWWAHISLWLVKKTSRHTYGSDG